MLLPIHKIENPLLSVIGAYALRLFTAPGLGKLRPPRCIGLTYRRLMTPRRATRGDLKAVLRLYGFLNPSDPLLDPQDNRCDRALEQHHI